MDKNSPTKDGSEALALPLRLIRAGTIFAAVYGQRKEHIMS